LVKVRKYQNGVSLAALCTVVARSPIVIAKPVIAKPKPSLARFPYGFEPTDIKILDWIIGTAAVHRPWSFRN
jgi:hypothetical protein